MVNVPSFRDFLRDKLVEKLLEDVKEHRIFNEADMQYRTAVHVDKSCYPDLFLVNQPIIPIGHGRGKYDVKPDIVIFHPEKGPVTAIELKCFLNTEYNLKSIIEYVWDDIEKLKGFRQRYPNSKNAFAVVFVNVSDTDDYWILDREFRREKEDWMKYYFYPHIINVYCDDNGRKRNWYNKWAADWIGLKEYFSDLY